MMAAVFTVGIFVDYSSALAQVGGNPLQETRIEFRVDDNLIRITLTQAGDVDKVEVCDEDGLNCQEAFGRPQEELAICYPMPPKVCEEDGQIVSTLDGAANHSGECV